MKNRRNKNNRPIIDLFLKKDRVARFWFALFLVSTLLFGLERWRLAAAIGRKPQFVVMDSNTYYLPKSVDFGSATELHSAQVTLAMESVFDRNPRGEDNPDRLVRLFDKDTLRDVRSAIAQDAAEFAGKQIHQKVEIASVEILEIRGTSVLATATGQLVRTGIFDGAPFTEVLDVDARFRFEYNRDILTNGGFPTVVTDFEFATEERGHDS